MQDITNNQLLAAQKILGETIKNSLDNRKSLVSEALSIRPKSFENAPNGVIQIGLSAFYPVIYEERYNFTTTDSLPAVGTVFPDGTAQAGYKVLGRTWVKNLQPKKYMTHKFKVLNSHANDRATLEREFILSKTRLQDIELLKTLTADYQCIDTATNGDTTVGTNVMKINKTIAHGNTGLTLKKLTDVRKYYTKNGIGLGAKIIGFCTYTQFHENLLKDTSFTDLFKVQLASQNYGKIDLGYDITAQTFDLTTHNIKLVIIPDDSMFSQANLWNSTTQCFKLPFCTQDSLTIYQSEVGDGSWRYENNPLIVQTKGSDFEMVSIHTGVLNKQQHDTVDLNFRFFGAGVRSANRDVVLVECKDTAPDFTALATEGSSLTTA